MTRCESVRYQCLNTLVTRARCPVGRVVSVQSVTTPPDRRGARTSPSLPQRQPTAEPRAIPSLWFPACCPRWRKAAPQPPTPPAPPLRHQEHPTVPPSAFLSPPSSPPLAPVAPARCVRPSLPPSLPLALPPPLPRQVVPRPFVRLVETVQKDRHGAQGALRVRRRRPPGRRALLLCGGRHRCLWVDRREPARNHLVEDDLRRSGRGREAPQGS